MNCSNLHMNLTRIFFIHMNFSSVPDSHEFLFTNHILFIEQPTISARSSEKVEPERNSPIWS